MRKEAYYFSHDSNAKDDPKSSLLIEELGLEGYGIYWVLIEILRDQPNYSYPLRMVPIVARKYNTTTPKVETVIRNYGLFIINEDAFFSLSLNLRMEQKDAKSLKAKESVTARWNKKYENDTNVLQTLSECNTIKESKVKEIKEKEIKIKTKEEIDFAKQNFKQTLIPFLEKYGKDMLKDFFLYWTQESKTGKLGFELEKTWSVEARLNTWSKRSFSNPNQQQTEQTQFVPNPKKQYNG
jgi:hypothetical protein